MRAVALGTDSQGNQDHLEKFIVLHLDCGESHVFFQSHVHSVQQSDGAENVN